MKLIKRSQKGQALIELIIFLPMMFMLYSLISGFANAINGSINQQKVTRSYFYYRLQNNSTIPKPDQEQAYKSWSKFGMFFIGWMEYFGTNSDPFLPCYRMSIPLKAADSDKCEEKYTKTTTQWIRVGTAYGICGGTYVKLGNGVALAPDFPGGTFSQVVDRSSCIITR